MVTKRQKMQKVMEQDMNRMMREGDMPVKMKPAKKRKKGGK